MDLVRMAATHDVPLATHLAESPDELELLDTGGGPMRKTARGSWCVGELGNPSRKPPAGLPPPTLRTLSPLVIHGNLLGKRKS
ncbi:MAG: hypothetical protein CM1200mP2_46630 [Planctomycetaceae bacterium]|nr:MAG: hypothetical protein CM1200mP2_46630 [Planctomycetaceae bacterium]